MKRAPSTRPRQSRSPFFERTPAPTEWCVPLRLSPTEHERLQQLINTGLFGVTLQDVIERGLCEKLREWELDGWIGPLPRRRRPRR